MGDRAIEPWQSIGRSRDRAKGEMRSRA